MSVQLPSSLTLPVPSCLCLSPVPYPPQVTSEALRLRTEAFWILGIQFLPPLTPDYVPLSSLSTTSCQLGGSQPLEQTVLS